MSQFNLDESDCIIEEKNVTCIIVDDSDNDADDENVSTPQPALEQDIEEGEVMENDGDNLQTETICEIKFPSEKQYEQLGSLFINIVKDKLGNQLDRVVEVVEEDHQRYVKLILQKKIKHVIEEIPMPKTPASNKEENGLFEKEDSPDLSGISELFTIDTAPTPKLDSVKVPSYKRAIKDALLDGEGAARKKQKDDENVFKTKKINTCFNCGETGHSIKECSKPHNAKRIKNARRGCFKVERYHVDVEQRFAHLKPGFLSAKLREALGLRKGELPFFFYRMRVLGYPPGWLEDAKVEHSGINLFNSDGTKMLNSDEDEGEIDPISHKFNISKIHDFPGFNQDPGNNFFDDYKYHNVPQMDKRQMKEEFIKTLGDNVLKGYKRKKLKYFPNATADGISNETTHETADMEIDDPEATIFGEVQFSRPPPPADQPLTPPPPPPPSSPSSCESPVTVGDTKERDLSTQSPSLLELEKQKQRLLQELDSNNTVIEIEDSLIDEIIELDEDVNKQNEENLNAKNSSANCAALTTVAENITVEDKTTAIKESFMGTPVLKFTPYNNLPNGENFKVGVSDVINFENLPDSTGKYEQMKQVIKKVRNCIFKLHSEE